MLFMTHYYIIMLNFFGVKNIVTQLYHIMLEILFYNSLRSNFPKTRVTATFWEYKVLCFRTKSERQILIQFTLKIFHILEKIARQNFEVAGLPQDLKLSQIFETLK